VYSASWKALQKHKCIFDFCLNDWVLCQFFDAILANNQGDVYENIFVFFCIFPGCFLVYPLGALT
jgi:hypothetical protein